MIRKGGCGLGGGRMLSGKGEAAKGKGGGLWSCKLR